MLGARLMMALRAHRPDLEFAGIGGPRMEALGLRSLFPMRELAVMGLVEILPRLWRLSRLLARTVDDVAARRPDVLVTIDSPGFALRLLRRMAGLGIRRVHYVAPQVWAWKERRVRDFPGLWDSLLCLLPFEPAYFARHGVAARFVGHPVLESGAADGDATRFRQRHGVADGAPVLVLMPGSRRSEVPRLLPVFGQTLTRLVRTHPDLVPVVPVSATVADQVMHAAAAWPVRPIVVTDLQDKHDAYAAAGAALTKSGTSTLELALAGVPMAVTYRVNPVTAAIARRMIKVPYVAMINLLAGRAVVPELLQGDCRPDRLADTIIRLFREPAMATAQRTAFATIVASLHPPRGQPSDAAARAVIAQLDRD